MATTKRLPKPPKTQTAVVKLIRYAINPEKTTDEKCLYVDSINCSVVGTAEQFKVVRDRWDKNSGNYAYHFEQSFKPGETSPAEAHQCGIELAQALFGSCGYQVVVCTHLDQAHLHNHFVVNSVNLLDGKKLQTDHDFIRRMREENDRICRAHNLSVVESPENKGKSYAEWIIDKNGGFTWRGMIREDIDALIPCVSTLKGLLDELSQCGYTVYHRGKYISLSPPGTNAHFRLYKLGKGYSEEDITERILYTGRRIVKQPEIKPIRIQVKTYRVKTKYPLKTKGGFRGLYYVYLYRLRNLLGASAQMQRKMPVQVRRDTNLFREFAEDAHLLFDNQIDSVDQLAEYYYTLDEQRKGLYAKRLTLREALGMCDTVETAKTLQSQIVAINSLLQRVNRQMKSCERIYERSACTKKANQQASIIQKGMIQKSQNESSQPFTTDSEKNERNDENVSRS